MKSVGANMPPGVPLEKERVVAMILKTASSEQHFQGELRVHGLVDGSVAGAHDLRQTEVADAADEKPSGGGLGELRRGWLAAE